MSQEYIHQHLFLRDADKHALGEIVRTTAAEWIEPFIQQVNDLTGLKITYEQGSNRGRSWSNALFPTQTNQPPMFWHSRVIFLLKLNGKKFALIEYKLSNTPNVIFDTTSFKPKTCKPLPLRVETHVDLTYPMFGFTTAPPLWEINEIRDVLIRCLLGMNVIQDSVSKARCLQTIGILHKASEICLNTIDIALNAIENLESQMSKVKSTLEEWDSAHLLEKTFQDDTCNKEG